MNYPLLNRLMNSIKSMKGYGLSNGKGKRMTAIRTQMQWAAQEENERKRKIIIKKARAMIEWSHTEYEREKANKNNSIKILALLTLNWSPERVLSKHKDFKRLCAALKDDKTWRMLSRKERRFIADAVSK